MYFSFLFSSFVDLVLQVWKINTKYIRNAFKVHTGSQWVLSLNFSPNGRLLISASPDNTLRLWNMRDGAAKVLTDDDPTFIDEPCFTSAAFSPDSRTVAASHRDGMVRIWVVCTGQLIRKVMAHVNWAWGLAFMPDGKGLVSGGGDDIMRYWDNNSLDTQFGAQMRPQRKFLGHKVLSDLLPVNPATNPSIP